MQFSLYSSYKYKMAAETGLMFLILCYLFTVARGGDVCYEYYYNSGTGIRSFQSTYCSTGCCTSDSDGICCSMSVGTIIGIVTGCLIIIGIIVFIFVIIACHKVNKKNVGVIIAPAAPVYGQNPHMPQYNQAWQAPSYSGSIAPYHPAEQSAPPYPPYHQKY